MANQRLRINTDIDFPNVAPAGIAGDDITWLSLHNASTPASGTAYLKIDITDVTSLVLGTTVTLPEDMTMIDYPNDDESNETELLGQSLLDHLNTTGFYVAAHDGDPGTEAQFFGQNQITELGRATVGTSDLEIVDA